MLETNEQIIAKAIELLQHNQVTIFWLSRNNLSLDVPKQHQNQVLFSLELDLDDLYLAEFHPREREHDAWKLVSTYSIPNSPDFAANMPQFVMLIRCKFPEVYSKWRKMCRRKHD